MKAAKLAITVGIAGIFSTGTAMAANVAAPTPNQRTASQQVAFDYDHYLSLAEQEQPNQSPSDTTFEEAEEEAADAAC